MAFFKYLFKQSERGLGRAFLVALLAGLIFSISVVVNLISVASGYGDEKLKEIGEETGCAIVNYTLTCNEDNYEYDDFIIDLDYEGKPSPYDDKVIFTSEGIITDTNMISYKQLLDNFNHGPDLTVNDLSTILSSFLGAMYFIVFFVLLLGGGIYFAIANAILALAMMVLIKSVMGIVLKYEQVYKLTIFTALPYIAFNALIRMIIGDSLVGYITSFLPIGSLLLHLLLDYAIIFGLTYLSIKNGYEKKEEIIDLPFENIVEVRTQNQEDSENQ